MGHHTKLSLKQCSEIEEDNKIRESIPYASKVESIMYGIVCSISDLKYIIGIISWFMENPGQINWEALTWVLWYLNGFLKGSIKYTKSTQEDDSLEGYVYSYCAGNVNTWKSLSCFFLYVVWDIYKLEGQ